MSLILAAALMTQCGNPLCDMCNKQYGPQQGYIFSWEAAPLVQPQPQPQVQSTPMAAVKRMLEVVKPTPKDLLYDIGCGDGRILIEAVKTYKCKAYGIEIDPAVADLARKRIRDAGLNINVLTGDATKYNLKAATIVTMYLHEDTMKKIIPRLGNCRIVSYLHPIPGLRNKVFSINGNIIYVADLSYLGY